MKPFFVFTLICAAVLFPSFAPMIAQPPVVPHMRKAIDLLESAKTAADPVPVLKEARRHLVKAKANKEGQRVQAIACVDEAMGFALTGDRKVMLEKIQEAIGNAKSGIARAP